MITVALVATSFAASATAQTVYVAEHAAGAGGGVYELPGTGPAIPLATGFQATGIAISRGGGAIFAATEDSDDAAPIVRVRRADGATTPLSNSGKLNFVLDLEQAPGGKIIAVESRLGAGEDGAVVAIAPRTGKVTVIARGGRLRDPYGLLLSASGKSALVADASSAGGGGAVLRVNLKTGRQSVVAKGGPFVDPSGIARAADGTLAVTDYGAEAILRVRPKSGATSVIASGDVGRPFTIARANGALFFSRDSFGGSGSVARLDGSTPVPIGSGLSEPYGIAIKP